MATINFVGIVHCGKLHRPEHTISVQALGQGLVSYFKTFTARADAVAVRCEVL